MSGSFQVTQSLLRCCPPRSKGGIICPIQATGHQLARTDGVPWAVALSKEGVLLVDLESGLTSIIVTSRPSSVTSYSDPLAFLHPVEVGR